MLISKAIIYSFISWSFSPCRERELYKGFPKYKYIMDEAICLDYFYLTLGNQTTSSLNCTSFVIENNCTRYELCLFLAKPFPILSTILMSTPGQGKQVPFLTSLDSKNKTSRFSQMTSRPGHSYVDP